MSQLTFTQHWLVPQGDGDVLPQPGPLPPESGVPDTLSATFFVTCNDGSNFLETFEAPESQSSTIEVADGAWCIIKHTIPSSAVETMGNCKNNINVMEDTECAYTSVVFDESIPTLQVGSMVVMVVLVVTAALLAVRKW